MRDKTENEDEYNVKLIHLKDDRYLMINSYNESIMNIIELDNAETIIRVNNSEEVTHEIISETNVLIFKI